MNRSPLKMIALIPMLLDHIGAMIVWPLYLDACVVGGVHMMGDLVPEQARKIYTLYLALRIIGRLAFPIFAFMVVEGVAHTRSVKKYVGRLFLFAALSEIPYDLAMTGSLFYPWGQNVLWTFAIAAVMIWALETYAANKETGEKQTLRAAAIIAAAALLSVFCDGGLGGTLLIACMYLFKGDRKRWWLSCILCLCVLTALGMAVQVFAVLALFLLQRYNGQKGRECKALFYVFYPIHLLALWWAGRLIA